MYQKLLLHVRNSLKSVAKLAGLYLILRELKYLPGLASLALLFAFLNSAFEGLGIGGIALLLQFLTTSDQPSIHTGVDWLDLWIRSDASVINQLWRVSALVLILIWVRSVFAYFAFVFLETTQYKILDHLRRQIFEQLQAFKVSYFTDVRSGELINTITTETERLKQAFGGIATLIILGLTSLVYIGLMILISWQLTLVTVMMFSLMIAGFSNFNKRLRELSFDVTTVAGQFTSTAMEFIGGIRTIQAFSTQNFERKKYYKSSSNIVNACIRTTVLLAFGKPLADGFASTILIGMLAGSFTILVANGKMQVASLLTFFLLLFRLVPLIQSINATQGQFSFFNGAIQGIETLLEVDNKPYFRNGKIAFSGLKESIEFASVHFGYDSDSLILSNINLTIKRGETTALVGASGAGKTTLADLIVRFYDPTRGKILVDGVDLRDLDITSFHQKMAVVSQDTFIFNASVWENIAYGLEEISEKKLFEAASLSNALEFIQELPEGLNTKLGDRGVRLSGGQRQRIAIARALLREPEILILDEATSALDSISERLIQESLEKLSSGRTVIAIAHRLSTIAKADKVVVLEQGRIVEQGTYQELLTKKGRLWNYHQVQHELSHKK